MKKYQHDLCKVISILLLAGSSLSTASQGQKDPFELDFPAYLVRKGLPRPGYNAHIDMGARDPILQYDLSDDNVARMATEFQLAQIAEQKEQSEMALRVYWNLAERGYAPANNRLFEAFRDGTLGLKEDVFVAGFYRDRPRTIEEMRYEQQSIREWLIRRQRQQQEEFAADAIQAAPLSLNEVDLLVVGEEYQSLLPKKGFTEEAAGLRRRKTAAH